MALFNPIALAQNSVNQGPQLSLSAADAESILASTLSEATSLAKSARKKALALSKGGKGFDPNIDNSEKKKFGKAVDEFNTATKEGLSAVSLFGGP